MPNLSRRFKFAARKRDKPKPHYGLRRNEWNIQLSIAFDDYEQWCTKKLNLKRVPSLRQRPTTFARGVLFFEDYFGYLVHVHGDLPDGLRLADVTDYARVESYVLWHAERVGGPSRHTQRTAGIFSRIARYYLHLPIEQWTELENLSKLIVPDIKHDKRANWISLSDLEQIGLSELPLPAELRRAGNRQERSKLALRSQRSLIIRLLIRRPLRNRNIRELQLGKNLYQSDGQWMLEFVGDELKIAKIGGQPHIYKILWPADLVKQLEEFLRVWRPLLIDDDNGPLFARSSGKAFTASSLGTEFKKAVYAYTGKQMNIHLVRDVWATEFLIDTQDFITAADILGDRIETVLERYAHLHRVQAGNVADRFIRKVTKRKT
jgi:hypothetical protein